MIIPPCRSFVKPQVKRECVVSTGQGKENDKHKVRQEKVVEASCALARQENAKRQGGQATQGSANPSALHNPSWPPLWGRPRFFTAKFVPSPPQQNFSVCDLIFKV
jgi:hypothetical protein